MPTKAAKSKKTPRKTPTTKLKDEIKILKLDIQQQDDKYLRLKAEFDNFRRRKSEEIIDLLKYDGEDVIKEFLSILDDLDRLKEALSTSKSSNDSKINEGIDLIINKIRKAKTDTLPMPGLNDDLEKRPEVGKGQSRSLRREGKTPAIIYGDEKKPVAIAINTQDLNLELQEDFTVVIQESKY